MGIYSADYAKAQFLTVVLLKCEKSVVKGSIEKQILLNFLDLSTIFPPRLTGERYFYL